jgi:hypothetical protein
MPAMALNMDSTVLEENCSVFIAVSTSRNSAASSTPSIFMQPVCVRVRGTLGTMERAAARDETSGNTEEEGTLANSFQSEKTTARSTATSAQNLFS